MDVLGSTGATSTTSTSPATTPDPTPTPAPITTTPPGEAPPDLSSTPHDDRTRAARPNQCLGLAAGPWTPVGYRSDPLQAVRDRRVPGLPHEGRNLVFQGIVEFPTLESYEDVSTLRDPASVMAAWGAAGYRDGVKAEFHQGNYQFVASAVRFADPAGAGQALTAHLQDYCHRSVDARPLAAGNGITVLRDLGAVRTLWVQGDVLLSVFSCVCYADDDRGRQDLVEQWAQEVTDILGTAPSRPDAV